MGFQSGVGTVYKYFSLTICRRSNIEPTLNTSVFETTLLDGLPVMRGDEIKFVRRLLRMDTSKSKLTP